MRIEIAYATSESQIVLEAEVKPGTTVGEAVTSACHAGDLPREAASLQTGIWGRVVDRGARLNDGDRVELYRPLAMDPREARRRLAEAGDTMSGNRVGKAGG